MPTEKSQKTIEAEKLYPTYYVKDKGSFYTKRLQCLFNSEFKKNKPIICIIDNKIKFLPENIRMMCTKVLNGDNVPDFENTSIVVSKDGNSVNIPFDTFVDPTGATKKDIYEEAMKLDKAFYPAKPEECFSTDPYEKIFGIKSVSTTVVPVMEPPFGGHVPISPTNPTIVSSINQLSKKIEQSSNPLIKETDEVANGVKDFFTKNPDFLNQFEMIQKMSGNKDISKALDEMVEINSEAFYDGYKQSDLVKVIVGLISTIVKNK